MRKRERGWINTLPDDHGLAHVCSSDYTSGYQFCSSTVEPILIKSRQPALGSSQMCTLIPERNKKSLSSCEGYGAVGL